MIISWVTTIEPGSSTVLYGTSEDNLNHSAKGKLTQYTFYNYTSGYIHHCTIKKLKVISSSKNNRSYFVKAGILVQYLIMNLLQFDTKYYYAVGTKETMRKFWFRTPPKSGPDVPYTFGLIGIVKCARLCAYDIVLYENNNSQNLPVICE
jgi:hypothetical protein